MKIPRKKVIQLNLEYSEARNNLRRAARGYSADILSNGTDDSTLLVLAAIKFSKACNAISDNHFRAHRRADKKGGK